MRFLTRLSVCSLSFGEDMTDWGTIDPTVTEGGLRYNSSLVQLRRTGSR